MYYLGFDIGGSSIKAALVENRKITKSIIEDTPDNLAGLLLLVLDMKDTLISGIDVKEVAGVGVGIAGILDEARQIILNSPNLKYLNNQPIKKLFEEKMTPYPVKIEHDVHCFLLAEKAIGLARELKSVFYMTLGTGIGTAWMIDNRIIYGAHGAAGEGGHMVIEASRGVDLDELEELAANKFIVKILGFGSIEAIKKAQAGDEKTKEVLAQLGRNLGIGLANIINAFDPGVIILSGGIAEAKEFIFSGLNESVAHYVISPEAKKTPILFSDLGRFGGALGAALLFR